MPYKPVYENSNCGWGLSLKPNPSQSGAMQWKPASAIWPMQVEIKI